MAGPLGGPQVTQHVLAGTESVLWELVSLAGDYCKRATLVTSCSGSLSLYMTSPSHIHFHHKAIHQDMLQPKESFPEANA